MNPKKRRKKKLSAYKKIDNNNVKRDEIITEIYSLKREEINGWEYVDAKELEAILERQHFDINNALKVLQEKNRVGPLILATILANNDEEPKRQFLSYVRMARKIHEALYKLTEFQGGVETYGIFDGVLQWNNPDSEEKVITHRISIRGHGADYAKQEFERLKTSFTPNKIFEQMRHLGWYVEEVYIGDETQYKEVEIMLSWTPEISET